MNNSQFQRNSQYEPRYDPKLNNNSNIEPRQLSPQLEHKFDQLLKGNNNKESLFSPLNYNPKYLEDIMAWEKLKGNQSPYQMKESVNNYVNHNFIFNPKISKPNNYSELESLKRNNLDKLSSPLVKSVFHLNIRNPRNNTNNTNIKNNSMSKSYDFSLNNNDNKTNILNLRENSQNGQPLYFDFQQNPTLQAYNYRPNYYKPHVHDNDRFNPIVNEIRNKIKMNNEFIDELNGKKQVDQNQGFNQKQHQGNNYNTINNKGNLGNSGNNSGGMASGYDYRSTPNTNSNKYTYIPLNKKEQYVNDFIHKNPNQHRNDYL